MYLPDRYDNGNPLLYMQAFDNSIFDTKAVNPVSIKNIMTFCVVQKTQSYSCELVLDIHNLYKELKRNIWQVTFYVFYIILSKCALFT